MSNKSMGNEFEADLCMALYENGFWTHNMAMNPCGQPADVIAVRNRRAYLIDCKVCSSGRLQLSRIEENQKLSMALWEECGNGEGWFAILIDRDIYMVSYRTIAANLRVKATMTEMDIKRAGFHIGEWMREICA